MSKMTSSTGSSHNHDNCTSNRRKTLTDFSIETIMGQPQATDYNNKSHHRKQLNQHSNSISNRATCTRRQQSSKSAEQTTQVTSQIRNRKYRPKNFQCPACKMAFSNNGQLKNHVRIHTGERPFRCNQPDCNKTFTRNEELTRHKLIHTGVRPHSCTTCGKRFGRKDHLKKHARTHDKKKLRKKVFVPTQAKRSYITEEDIFVPPKPAVVKRLNHADATNLLNILPPPVTSSHNTFAHHLLPPPTATASSVPPPVSTIDPCLHLYTHPSALATSAACATTLAQTTTTTTTSAVQQLASDYWNKWYNLLGLYHHHYPPADNLSGSGGGLYRK